MSIVLKRSFVTLVDIPDFNLLSIVKRKMKSNNIPDSVFEEMQDKIF